MHIHIECMMEGSLYSIDKGTTNEDVIWNFTKTKDGIWWSDT
jgi:hypothetical protein